MPFDTFDFETLNEERRKAVAESIRVVSIPELTKLGNEIFHYADDPWRDTYFQFLKENAHATIYHGVTNDAVTILYCPDCDRGMWFIAGSGMGPLQASGRQAMKKIIEGKH